MDEQTGTTEMNMNDPLLAQGQGEEEPVIPVDMPEEEPVIPIEIPETGEQEEPEEEPEEDTEDENDGIDELRIDGFHFLNRADAKKAELDLTKIRYLTSHASYERPEAMRAVYVKAIENRIFSTPVGFSFLHDLYERMRAMGEDVESLPAIPLQTSFSHEPLQSLSDQARRAAAGQEKGRSVLSRISLFINILLLLVVTGMFLILYYGETDNILNYKRNVTNRYASWEQELMERERALRAKERDMGINSSDLKTTTGEEEGE